MSLHQKKTATATTTETITTAETVTSSTVTSTTTTTMATAASQITTRSKTAVASTSTGATSTQSTSISTGATPTLAHHKSIHLPALQCVIFESKNFLDLHIARKHKDNFSCLGKVVNRAKNMIALLCPLIGTLCGHTSEHYTSTSGAIIV